jgi:hypothetical protein
VNVSRIKVLACRGGAGRVPLGFVFLLALVWLGLAGNTRAQDRTPFFKRLNAGKYGIGFNFSADFNYFFRAIEFPLINGNFSNINVGASYKHYVKYGVIESGANFLYKGLSGETNFPLVTQNFGPNENTALTAGEVYLRVGPQIARWVYPKFGFIAGYRFRQVGFLEPNENWGLHRLYLAIPIGLSLDLPTGFGTTGLGFYYKVGLTNVIRDPSITWDDGGRLRSWNFEIHVMFDLSPQD